MKERRLLKAKDLRALGRPADYFTYQTRDERVARSQPLRAQQSTNPMHNDFQVCLFNGFFRPNYGDYHVIFRKRDLPLAVPANPPEWKVSGVVDQDAVGYTTTAELRVAGIPLL